MAAAQLAPWNVYSYDAAGNLLSAADRLDNTTTFGYDAIGRKVSVTDPNDATTEFSFDAAGNMATLSDPLDNTTTWSYDHAGRVVEEQNELEASRTFEYDVAGNLSRKTDRNGRVTEYGYDLMRRRTSETWKDGETTVREFSFTYNRAGEMLTASDPAADYTYEYDARGRAKSVTHAIDGLTPSVVMAQQYGPLGGRSQLAVTLGGTADLKNVYTFDGFGRTSRIDQSGVAGGNAVAEKRFNFAYDNGDQPSTLTRYNNVAGSQTVATSTYGFDLTGRLTGLTYAKGGTTLAGYNWSFDAANRMTQYVNSIDGTVNYTNDDAGQLTGADYTYSPVLADETFVYDDNGNRTNDGFTVGTNNRLTSDGTYRYEYDAEGNRTARYVDADSSGSFNSGDTSVTEYEWDYRNRLTKVTTRATFGGAATKILQYAYDHQNRLVRKLLDSNGDTTVDSSAVFIHDENQIALQFDKTGLGDAVSSNLSHRYAWGPTVDQILADEQVTSLGTAGTVLWPLTDHLNTVRDLASYNSGTDTTTVSNHRVYLAYGNIASETNSAVHHLFCFTGRHIDTDTGLQNNLKRWYDSGVGGWLSEDPTGYNGGINLYEYVGDKPTNASDPMGTCSEMPLGPSPLPITPRPGGFPPPAYIGRDPNDDTIVCFDDGQGNHGLVVQTNKNGPDIACIFAHENQHIADFYLYYGRNVCKGHGAKPPERPKQPHNDDADFKEFLRRSECKAYHVSLRCRQKLLAELEKKANCHIGDIEGRKLLMPITTYLTTSRKT